MFKKKKLTNPGRKKLHIKKGDVVRVTTGDDRGKDGRVLAVMLKENRAIIEGVNFVSKHTKPDAKNPNGGIVKKEASVHVSNLLLLDPKSGKPTRIGRREEKGKVVRYAKSSGEVIK